VKTVTAALLAAVTMLAAGATGTSGAAALKTRLPGAASPSGEWPYPNGDLANTRDAPGVPTLPLGAATVSRDLIFTDLYNGVLIALDRGTGKIVYRRQLPTSANAPVEVFGNTVLVSAGGPPTTRTGGGGNPQLVAYTLS
jgi:hypothetical protein